MTTSASSSIHLASLGLSQPCVQDNTMTKQLLSAPASYASRPTLYARYPIPVAQMLRHDSSASANTYSIKSVELNMHSAGNWITIIRPRRCDAGSQRQITATSHSRNLQAGVYHALYADLCSVLLRTETLSLLVRHL